MAMVTRKLPVQLSEAEGAKLGHELAVEPLSKAECDVLTDYYYRAPLSYTIHEFAVDVAAAQCRKVCHAKLPTVEELAKVAEEAIAFNLMHRSKPDRLPPGVAVAKAVLSHLGAQSGSTGDVACSNCNGLGEVTVDRIGDGPEGRQIPCPKCSPAEAPMPRLEKWIENYEKTPNAEFSLTVSETGDMLAAARADLADEVKSRDKCIAQLESDLAGTQDVVRRNSQEAHDVVSRLRMQLDDAGQQLKAHADASAEMRQQYERAAKDAKELAELRARARQHREVILIAFKDWPRFRALLHICQSEKKGSE
jgi:hypothetical protein